MADPDSFRSLFGGKRLLWQTRTASYCIGLDEWAPLGAVLCLDDGDDLELMEQRCGIRFFSRERVERRRRSFGDEPDTYVCAPEQLKQVLEFLEANRRMDWIAASPYPSAPLKQAAARLSIPCCVRDWSEFQRFGAKSSLRTCLEELDLPRLPARRIRINTARYSELAREFGVRFVLQRDFDAAGRGTRVAGSVEELAAAAEVFAGEEVWVAPYAGPLSFNVNAAATEAGTAVGYPSVQIVGQAVLGGSPHGHCGNDFTAARGADQSLLNGIREQTDRIGCWLAARGYRGLFGLDFVIDERRGLPCAVDLNPRWQGSTSLQAQAESCQGRLPLAAAELAYRLGLLGLRELMGMADGFFEPLAGSQMFPKAQSEGWWCAQEALKAGIYALDLTAWRPGLRLGELQTQDQVVITGGLPRPGRAMQGGSTLARICALRASVNPSTGQLLPWAERTARLLSQRLALRAAQSHLHASHRGV